jgi:dihydrofolate reductase
VGRWFDPSRAHKDFSERPDFFSGGHVTTHTPVFNQVFMATVFKIIIHMVSSLDGYIARKDNSVSWFETPDHYEKGVALTNEDVGEFLKTIDCYIMGANTYEHALDLATSYGWAYGDTPTIVLTHRKLPVHRENIVLYAGDLNRLVKEQLVPAYRNVWVVGGAKLAKDFMLLNLVDEIRLSVLPVILGDGTPFFDPPGEEQRLHLKDVTAHQSGMVELCYEIVK